MESFKIDSSFRIFYGIFLFILLIGFKENYLKSESPSGSILLFSALAILALQLMSTRIKIEEDGITHIQLFFIKKKILFSEIGGLTILINPLFAMHFKGLKYYLGIATANKDYKIKNYRILRIYSFANSKRLLDLLEKKTGKPIENRK